MFVNCVHCVTFVFGVLIYDLNIRPILCLVTYNAVIHVRF